MDCETNIDSIRALDDQIREHEKTIIQLKRARNSLLNVSKFPPEVLGGIFSWNVTLNGDFDGLDKRSHNFLLVCHHWFEVASRTPEIWSFWGNTPKDWARRYRHSGTNPLDLVFSYSHGSYFNTTLCSVLQDRAARDAIRRVHLMAHDSALLNSIIAPLTSNHEEVRSNSIESFILRNEGNLPVDVSNFFANYRFSKLRRLELADCTIGPWNRLTSLTSVLTTLKFDFSHPSLAPTTSQLFSILASNPALQKLALLRCAVPSDGSDGSSSQVQLRHMKGLELMGDLRHVIGLLHQLDHPRNLDDLSLNLHNCDATDISQVIGPYLRDHLQRRSRPQNGLKISVSSWYRASEAPYIVFHVGDANGISFSVPGGARSDMFVAITVVLNGIRHVDVLKRATVDLVTHTPQEEVVYFQTYGGLVPTEDIYTRLPNLRALSFDMVPLLTAFPSTLARDRNILLSLVHVSLKSMFVNDGGWSPLVTFLACRLSSGNRLDTLVIINSHSMSPEVLEGIGGMVRELKLEG